MKMLFLLILQFCSPAQAADWHQYIPNEQHLKEAKNWILRNSSRETRLFLYSNLPHLFPLSSLCELSDGSTKRGILPGEEFEIQNEGATLKCTGEFAASLSKGSAGIRGVAETSLALTRGAAEILVQNTSATLDVVDFQLKFRASEPNAHFSLRRNQNGSLIFCIQGKIDGELSEISPLKSSQQYIGNYNCQLSLTMKPSTEKRRLYANEVIRSADLYVPKNLQPAVHESMPGKNFSMPYPMTYNPSPILISPEPTNKFDAPLVLNIFRRSPSPASCILYTQAREEAVATEAYKFDVGLENKFTLKLHPDYRTFFLSAICTNKSGQMISNLLPAVGQARRK